MEEELRPREVKYLLRVTQLVESLHSFTPMLSLAPHGLQGCDDDRGGWDIP